MPDSDPLAPAETHAPAPGFPAPISGGSSTNGPLTLETDLLGSRTLPDGAARATELEDLARRAAISRSRCPALAATARSVGQGHYPVLVCLSVTQGAPPRSPPDRWCSARSPKAVRLAPGRSATMASSAHSSAAPPPASAHHLLRPLAARRLPDLAAGADVLKMTEVSRPRSLDTLHRYASRSNLLKRAATHVRLPGQTARRRWRDEICRVWLWHLPGWRAFGRDGATASGD